VFDHELTAWWDPLAVVAAAAQAASIALQRSPVLAFGLRDHRAALDVAWIGEPSAAGQVSQAVPPDVADWLDRPGDALDAALMHAPAVIRSSFGPMLGAQGSDTLWLVPTRNDAGFAGGIVYVSAADERSRLGGELDDLRSFITSIGLALGRANAQAAARRLSDDLAETNRRLQQMQAELLRSRTLSMIAEMAAGAGHELNSPLTVISGRAQMLAKTLSDPDALRSLELIRVKAHECSQIVSELMDFARPRPPRVDRVRLDELLEEIRAQWARHAQFPADRLQLRVEFAAGEQGAADELVTIPGDPDQLKRVFRELIANADDALAGRTGTIEMTCRRAVTEGFVEVLVRDEGCGMSPEVLQRAFDPFYSHRNAGRGRGLGLPRVYRIVEGHGGRIWLESAPEAGTTAHVLLPVGSVGASAAPPEQEAASG
jgi:signal transduction histidine kinase